MRKVPRYDLETDSRGALLSTLVPPPAHPHEAITGESTGILGRRVLVVTSLEWVHDMRAVSDPMRTPEGEWVIQVCDEAVWYLSHRDPDAISPQTIHVHPVDMVFLDE